MKTLIIVESPSKCKKIESYLGSAYKVVASYGHFTKLDSLEQISFDTFQIAYKVDKGKVLKDIKEEIKKCKEVILATDDDREGEAIAWALCVFCKLDLKKTKKMVFQEITKPALLHGLNHLDCVNMDRVKSQQARQILDIYIGYKVSPMLWKYVQHTLSAGRCQSPALRLVYENQKELDTMSLCTHYHVKGLFTPKRIPFTCHPHVKKEDITRFMNKIMSSSCWKIAVKKERQVKEAPPLILITSTLQQKAHQTLRMSPKQTMKYAQELYENGLITYMRTDSACYSKDFIHLLEKHIKQHYGEKYLHPHLSSLHQNKNKNKSQEAHEGIRVCDLSVEKSNVKTSSANTLYDFIYKHTIQCGMSHAIYHETLFEIPYEKDYVFQHKDKQCTFRGWTMLNKVTSVVSFVTYLSLLYETKETIPLMYVEADEVLMKSKYHYHEASLIQKLESLNIGRPSTYASILSSLMDKKYVIKTNIEGIMMDVVKYIYIKDKGIQEEGQKKPMNQEKNKLCITPIGKQVCEFCYIHFNEVFQYSFSEFMETSLDKIESKDIKQKEVLDSYIEKVNSLIEKTNEHYKKNPEQIHKVKDQSLHCGEYKKVPLYIKNGKFGYYVCVGKKDKISLKDFTSFSIEDKIMEQTNLTPEQYKSLIYYIENGEKNRNENIHIILSDDYSIRKSKYGYYIYYKTKRMKKPRFLKYNDEKDDQHETRLQWIEENNKQEIINYLCEKYKITI
jgi:DNA topoisomerase-1